MQENKDRCLCPYCNYTISCEMSFCKKCEIEFVICEKCKGLIRKGADICPHCGARKENRNE